MMVDDTFNAGIDEIIGPLEREMRRRNSLPYDGVMGTLPEWVPENFIREFNTTRDRLLEKHTHEHLLGCIEIGIATAKSHRMGGMLTGKPFDLTEGIFEFSEAPGMRSASFLARMIKAVGLGPVDGLALLTDQAFAERVQKGDDYGLHQSSIAQNPRGKVGDDGETVNQIIGAVAMNREYIEEGAKELWLRFIGELDDRGLDPEDTEDPNNWKKNVCEYDFKDGRRSITGGQFANVASDYRTGKKSG